MNRGAFVAILLGLVASAGLGLAALNRSSSDSTKVAESGSVADPGVVQAADAPGSKDPEAEREGDSQNSSSRLAPPVLAEAGTLRDIDGWLNTDKSSLEDFDGQVKILQFWTYSCYNCTNTLPYLQDIYAQYEPEGLEIIGVHSPEFKREEDPANVSQAALDLEVTWPIALDTSKVNFRSWQEGTNYWPRTYVIDQNGDIRFDKIGEGKYQELEDTVAYLIENGP